MNQEIIKLDVNLLHLRDTLLDLQNYSFDFDIIKQIDYLKYLVDKRLFSSLKDKKSLIKEVSYQILVEYE